jgi:SAM-dependent MidA family methyltransferase
MEQALYGPEGFYRGEGRPADHFRTSVHASSLFTTAIAGLINDVDRLLERPDPLDVVDLGSGGAELLTGLLACIPEHIASRARLTAVELLPPPTGLDPRIRWRSEPPNDIVGVIIANEWLDNVPLTIVQRTAQGVAEVLVDETTGAETLGAAPSDVDRRWLETWWPLDDAHEGDRGEVGTTRDVAWQGALSCLQRGLALGVDYCHDLASRKQGVYSAGTIAGFRDGRWVTPLPDGTCDITAHVALDACAAQAESNGIGSSLLTTQREALTSLGVSGARPPIELASTEPAAYITALREASEAGELLDVAGLGAFGWLIQTRGIGLPPSLSSLSADGVPQQLP